MTQPTTREILTRARARIAAQPGVCKGTFAERAGGEVCYRDDPRAIRWCMLGAIHSDSLGTRNAEYRLMAALRFADWDEIADWADSLPDATWRSEVLAAFDRAIAACEE